MSAPLISVIVPVYNVEASLPKCLDSILTQTYSNFELILIDDGSTDGSGRICDTYAAKESRIKTIHQPNKGVASARNKGLDTAAGEYISFVDADDRVHPDYLKELYQLISLTDAGIAACNHWIVRNGVYTKRFNSRRRIQKLSIREAYKGVLYDKIPDVSPWGKLYRKEVFARLRYPDVKAYDDTFIIADLLKAGNGIIFGNKPLYIYTITNTSLSRGKFRPVVLSYIDAVSSMTAKILSIYPNLWRGCVRRQVHAALSTRRYLIDCGEGDQVVRDKLESIVKTSAKTVLSDFEAPLRDKAGIISILISSQTYDTLWKSYEHIVRKEP